MMAKLSVVIPIYNKANFLSKCLDSVISQTLGDLEIICVDDGSTDESLSITKQYALRDSRIVVHSKPNGGVSSARNAGMELVTCEYVTFVDPDDHLLDPLAYENMVKMMESDDSDIVFAFFYDCDENGKIIGNRFEGFSPNKAVTLHEKARFIQFAYPWQKLYRRELFERSRAQFPNSIVFEDNPFNLNLIIAANQISVYPNYIFKYIHNSESITKQRNLNAFNMFTAVALMERELEKNKIIDREFVTIYIDYRLELLAWGYFSLPQTIRYKLKYLQQWEKVLTSRDRKRLMFCPERNFQEVYKYVATGNSSLFLINQVSSRLPRVFSYLLRLFYTLVNVRKICKN